MTGNADRAPDKSERARVWQRIQQDAPDTAAFLSAVAATFGKPSAVRVDIEGETVLQVGAPFVEGTAISPAPPWIPPPENPRGRV